MEISRQCSYSFYIIHVTLLIHFMKKIIVISNITVNVGDDYNEHELELFISVKNPAQFNTTLTLHGM